MKKAIYILVIYLALITLLPTVRALKVQFGSNFELTCDKNEDFSCEKGKFVMSLNFSPVQIVKEIGFSFSRIFYLPEKKSIDFYYESFIVSNFLHAVWHPPKHLLYI